MVSQPSRRIMKPIQISKLVLLALFSAATPSWSAQVEEGFTSLFDGGTLNGWKLVDKRGDGYGVKNGAIYCAKGGGGRLYTEKEYADFVLRFEFKLEDGSNNGLGIRAPYEGDPAYVAMELQILDDSSERYGGKLRPAQYHGSVYDVVPAKRGALKKAGEWNSQEVTALGRRIEVVLNGQTILETDLNEVTDPAALRKHPGLLRDRGHIGFLGHDDYVEFRNIRIKELPTREKDN